MISTNNRPDEELRQTALELFQAGVRRADPVGAVEQALRERTAQIAAAERIFLLALGKAAVPMARSALPFLAEKLAGTVVVTNPENAAPVPGATVISGGHPLPDKNSVRGGEALEQLALQAKKSDLVVCLVSGGGSALVCSPAEGVTLEDKIALNDALIRSGADIREINVVRSAVSRLKGGGLARAAAPAAVLALIVSDVPGDDLATIASGPTLWPSPSPQAQREHALAILARYRLLHALPAGPRNALASTSAAAPPPAGLTVENRVIGSNRLSVDAMQEAAVSMGWTVLRLPGWLDGDVADATRRMHTLCLEQTAAPIAILSGGEPTVQVTGSGRGGRNQELALRFALQAEASPLARSFVFLSGGTDGRDGPTDAAGAFVNAGTPHRIRAAGLDPLTLLGNNDAYPALRASGDLLITGATGTNVADLQVILLGAKENAAA